MAILLDIKAGETWEFLQIPRTETEQAKECVLLAVYKNLQKISERLHFAYQPENLSLAGIDV